MYHNIIFLLVFGLPLIETQNNEVTGSKCGSMACLKTSNEKECGICARKSQSDEDSCMYPFDYRYSVVAKTSCSVDLCWSESCSGIARPVDIDTGEKDPRCDIDSYATNVCHCESNMFGEFCNHKDSAVNDADIAKEINPIFSLRQAAVKEFFFFIAMKQFGNKAEYTVYTSEGDFKSFSTTFSRIYKGDIVDMCRKNTDLNSVCNVLGKNKNTLTKLRFPVINTPGKLLFVRNTIAGYMTKVSLVVDHPALQPSMKDKSLVFNKTFPILITYPEDIECTPMIQLSNCGSYSNSPVFPPTLDIQIFATIENPAFFKVCETTENFSWKVWRVTVNSLNEGESPMQMLYGKTVLFYPPYELVAGTYKVVFETSFVHRKKSLSIDNFGQCFFKVQLRQLVSVIEGAPVIYWYDHTKDWNETEPYQMLFGNGSFDPNTGSSDGLQYRWGCKRDPPGGRCGTKCDLATSDPKHRYIALKTSGSSWETLNCSYAEDINFRITLTVRKPGVEPGVAHATVRFNETKSKYNMFIECVSCSSGVANPKDVIILQVNYRFKNPQFYWEYAEVGQSSMQSVEDIAESGTSVDLIKIKENSLKMDRMYNFSVTETRVNVMTYMQFTTPLEPKVECKPVCNPPNGKRVTTVFNLNPCPTEGPVTIYEFYEKSDGDEVLFSGRMLATSNTLDLKEFRLVRSGKFLVYAFDSSKMASEINIPVELANDTITRDTIDSLIAKFQYHAHSGEGHLQNALRLSSAITESITPELDENNGTLKMILSTLKDFTLTTLADEKLYLSSLHSLYVAISKQTESFTMDANYGKQSSITLLKITNHLVKRMFNMQGETTLTPKIARQMIRTIFHCLEVAIQLKNLKVLETPREYVDPIILQTVHSTSFRLVTCLDKLMITLLKNQLTGDTHSEIESSDKIIYSWVKAGFPETMATVTRNTYRFPMSISDKLVQSLEKLTNNIGITFIKLKWTDPFWWSGMRIDTDVLMIMFCARSTARACENIEFVKHPLLMSYMIKQTVKSVVHLERNASRLRENMSPVELDMGITIYRLDLPLRAKLFTEFIFENKDNSTLTHFKVIILKNKRPDYKTVEEQGQVMTPASPIYHLIYEKSDADRFYYMGVLPLTQTGLSLFQESREPLKFKVKMYYVVCLTWVTWQWSRRGCYVSQKTNSTRLLCECTHFSIFGGTVDIPELQLSPAHIQPLLLTQQVNYLPLLLVLGLLALFLLLTLWAFIVSSRERAKMQGDVIVLEDNYPGEHYAFLLGVFTGSRINAGTDANVGIKLYGEADESRPHILKSSLRKTLRGNSDDWFLLYCPRPLGDITHLHVWHDNTGSSPDWFVEKVEVYDLTDQMQYLFELNLWLALEMNEHPEAIASTASIAEIYSVKNLFMNNVVAGLRDTHYWTSIFWKHPRNPVTRVQRIAVVLCFVMVAMAVSMFIFSKHYTSDWREDLPGYSVELFEFFIFSVSFCCASITACLVMTLFRKSHSLKIMRSRSTMFARKENTKEITQIFDEDRKIMLAHETSKQHPVASSTRSIVSGMSIVGGQPSNQLHYYELSKANFEANLLKYGLGGASFKDRSKCQHIVAALHVVVRGSPLAPVKLPDYNSSIIVHTGILIATWLVCLIITLLSLVLVIYCGMTLQPVETLIWLTIFISVLIFDALVVSIVKILVCSTVLSFMFQRMVYINSYIVNPKHASRKHLRGDLAHLFWLLDVRSQRMYCPMHESDKANYRKRKWIEMNWRKLLDFVVVLLLILVLVMLSFEFTRNYYPSNEHNRRMLTNGQMENVKNLKDIFNRTDFELFIKYKFIGQLYRYMWYSLEPLVNLNTTEATRKEWAYDCVTRLLGSARLRQLRVAKGACSNINNEELWYLTADCSATWSLSAEDKGVYDIQWAAADSEDVQRTRTDWKWMDGKYSNSSRYYGRSATLYHRGGFISDLGYTKQEAELEVAKLIKDHWLDHYTRAVFVELTLYNVNTRLFSQVALIIEQTPFGVYLPLAKVQSVTRHVDFNFWNISFVIFLIFFLLRTCLLMNRNGIFTFMSTNLNVYEVFLLALGFFTAFLQIISFLNSTHYMREFKRGGMDQFFNFFKIVNYTLLSKIALSLLITCVVVRMFISWHFGRIFISFYYTFFLSRSWIIWLTFYYMIFLVATWRFIGYFLNVFIFYFYSSLIIYYKDFAIDFQDSFLSKIVLYFMCFISLLVIVLFMISFVYYYRVAKQYRIRKEEYFNYISFLRQGVCRQKK